MAELPIHGSERSLGARTGRATPIVEQEVESRSQRRQRVSKLVREHGQKFVFLAIGLYEFGRAFLDTLLELLVEAG
jgi:hypothetical protein